MAENIVSLHKIVPLSRRYEFPGVEPFDHIKLRVPTFRDTHVAGLGAPQEIQMGPNGLNMLMTYPEVVDGYAQRLVVSPSYDAACSIEAIDAMALQRAICGFFISTKESEKPPTGSPSASVSQS
ncbi:conserved hypothetical protein [Agrobacterium deltaense Zutra 3/1]|uniref:Uncharacterized protein n=1 Tax=Agrobacterium deltaense Zutra 3/1 TaxID=1183427 RepID=A0A1S7PL70_9HYPH|nr:hypothetical protein [Agrobacterium deltaense]CUX23167.1 conserved hypothetical protein [Agrobacterium deltaense Zutra 3/1]